VASREVSAEEQAATRRRSKELAANRTLCAAIVGVAGPAAALAPVVDAPLAVRIALLVVATLGAVAGLIFHLLERRLPSLDDPPPALLERVVPRADLNKPMKFVNRDDELAHLNRVLDRAELGQGPLVAVLEGLPGVGKSAVGRYWADRVRERFPDGDLVADFSERRRGAGVDVSGVLGDFIRKLGPPGTVVPANLAERVERFRQMTFDRKLLVLLDDVSEAAQVNQLRPAGRESLCIATSYRPMQELYYRGAELVPVNPLPPERAEDLLVKMAGEFGSAFEEHRADTQALVGFCGGLALPLCVCAARLLVGRGNRTVASIVADVADEQRRLDYLAGEGEYAGAAVFGFAYADLPQNQRLTYRRIALHPGVDLSATHAAVLTGLSVPEASEQLMGLADTHLLGPLEDGRYRFHDLVRLHARECAVTEEPETVREELLSQLVDWYRASLRIADHALISNRLRLAPDEPIQAGHLPEFTGREDVFDWLESERSNILAVLQSARDREWDDRVWWMVESLWLFHYNRRHYADWIEATQWAIDSARRVGHRDAEARMRIQLAWAFVELGRFDDAHHQLDRANRAVPASSRSQLRGSVREFTGACYLNEGNYDLALDALAEAREVAVGLKNDRAVALQDYFIGSALIGKGEYAAALEALRPALDTMRRSDVDDQMFVGRLLLRIGQATRQSGDVDDAEAALQEGLEVLVRLGMRVEEAETYEELAAVAEARNDAKTASAQRQRAQAIYRALGHPRAGAVPTVAPIQ
jgi:tetratricopeptide (TPR) repeat protein